MKKYLIALAVVGITTTSCYEKLNITPPNAITNEQVKKLLETADEATTANLMKGIAGGLPTKFLKYDSGSGALEYKYNRYIGTTVMRSFEGNDVVPGQLGHSGYGSDEYKLNDFTSTSTDKNLFYWKIPYVCAADANKVLDFVTDELVAKNAALGKYMAWALFVRAYAYNILLENYQDAYMLGGSTKLGVPYYDKFDVAQDYKARSSMTEVYGYINQDLDKALSYLEFTSDKTDIDASALYFLKARVALCTGDWNAAVSACQQIIDHSGADFMTEAQYVNQPTVKDGQDYYFAQNSGFLYLNNNPECLYGWTVTDTKDNSYHNYFYNTYGIGLGGSSGAYARIDDRLYNKIDGDDYRKKNFLTNPPAGDYHYASDANQHILPYANIKFAASVGSGIAPDSENPLSKDNIVGTSTLVDYTLMRLSEVYLMKAEAESYINASAAEQTLSTLISKRTNGLKDYASYNWPSDASTLLQRIQLQSRIELWGEQGLEYYNNRRWNIPIERSGSTVHWQNATLSVAGMTLKIPQSAIDYNGLLVQN